MRDAAAGGTGASHAGEAVRRARVANGVSVRGLARRIGVSPATVSAIENGRTGITVQRLQEVATALGVPASALLEGEAPAVAEVHPESLPSLTNGDWRRFEPLPIDSVLAAAIRAFVATGYHGASMKSVAQLAEISVPGVYYHYPSKQDLLVKALDITLTDLAWRVERAREEGSTPVERVALFVEALALYHARRRDVAFLGASEMRSLEPEHYRRIAAGRADVQHKLDHEIAAAVAEGDLEVEDVPNAGRAIATMCTALAQWFQAHGPTTPETIAKEYAEFALRMLGHRGPVTR